MSKASEFKKLTQRQWEDLVEENKKLKFALEIIADDEDDLPFSTKIARLALDDEFG